MKEPLANEQDSPLSSLKELVRLSKLATPGPWWGDYAHEGKKMWPGIECKNPPAHRNYLLRMFTKSDYHDQQWNDMRFICEARNAIPSLEALLSRHEKLCDWIKRAEHTRSCNVHWGSRQFVMNSEQAKRFAKIKTPCDCGLDELRSAIEGGPTA